MCCNSYNNNAFKKFCLRKGIADGPAMRCVNAVFILANIQTERGAKRLRPSCYLEEVLVLFKEQSHILIAFSIQETLTEMQWFICFLTCQMSSKLPGSNLWYMKKLLLTSVTGIVSNDLIERTSFETLLQFSQPWYFRLLFGYFQPFLSVRLVPV